MKELTSFAFQVCLAKNCYNHYSMQYYCMKLHLFIKRFTSAKLLSLAWAFSFACTGVVYGAEDPDYMPRVGLASVVGNMRRFAQAAIREQFRREGQGWDQFGGQNRQAHSGGHQHSSINLRAEDPYIKKKLESYLALPQPEEHLDTFERLVKDWRTDAFGSSSEKVLKPVEEAKHIPKRYKQEFLQAGMQLSKQAIKKIQEYIEELFDQLRDALSPKGRRSLSSI